MQVRNDQDLVVRKSPSRQSACPVHWKLWDRSLGPNKSGMVVHPEEESQASKVQTHPWLLTEFVTYPQKTKRNTKCRERLSNGSALELLCGL